MHAALKDAELYSVDDENLSAYLQAVHNGTFSFDNSIVWYTDFDYDNQAYRDGVRALADEFIATATKYKS